MIFNEALFSNHFSDYGITKVNFLSTYSYTSYDKLAQQTNYIYIYAIYAFLWYWVL